MGVLEMISTLPIEIMDANIHWNVRAKNEKLVNQIS